MTRTAFRMIVCTLALAGCSSEPDSTSGPYRDQWRTVIDQPFIVHEADGTIAIGELAIGNASGKNFRNRGDIIVEYADTDRIKVEMRRFTHAANETDAALDFEKLSVWAASTSFPEAPFELDAEDNCVDPKGEMPWPDGCRVAVFYEGQVQLFRAGADLRVTLPKSFIYQLTVETDDNDADADYQNRGNVCIDGLPGSADITLSNGSAWVILDETMSEMPECPAALRAECEQGDNPWASDCGCLADGYGFSGVKITSNDGQAASATVDVPREFWTSYSLRNSGDNVPGDDRPGASCEAVVEPSTGVIVRQDNIDLGQDAGYDVGSINFPGLPAVSGAGYRVSMESDQCLVISATEDPDDFAGINQGPEQAADERGNLRMCAGCVRDMGCEALVPGL